MLRLFVVAVALMCATAVHAECAAGSTAQQVQGNMQRKAVVSDIGGQIGGIFGSMIANRAGINSYDAKKLGHTLGTQAGLMAAGPLTSNLDACDQQWVTNSTQQTLENQKETKWSGDTGTSGTNKIIPTSPNVLAANPGKICRTVQQSVTLKDGSAGVQNVTACKGDDGVWQPVKS